MTHEQEACELLAVVRQARDEVKTRKQLIQERDKALRQRDAARAKVTELTALLDNQLGTPCEQIRHAEEVATLTGQRDNAKARINELNALIAEERVFARAAIDEAKDAADQYKAQRDKAVEALRPFARHAAAYEPDEGDSDQMAWDAGIILTIGQLRKAAAVVREIDHG